MFDVAVATSVWGVGGSPPGHAKMVTVAFSLDVLYYGDITLGRSVFTPGTLKNHMSLLRKSTVSHSGSSVSKYLVQYSQLTRKTFRR